jgi:hypothetical protein
MEFGFLPYYISIPEPQNSTGPVPVFRSSVDCPANVWSAIRSCPELAGWILAIGLGGFLVGLYMGRR